MADYPLINGLRPDWARTQVFFNDFSEQEWGIKEINYTDENEAGEGYGAGSQMLFDTAGTYKAEGSLSLYKVEANALRQRLGAGFYTVKFRIVVAYRVGDADYIVDEIEGVRLKKTDASNQQGTDPTLEKIDFKAFYIKWNGVLPMPDMREGGS